MKKPTWLRGWLHSWAAEQGLQWQSLHFGPTGGLFFELAASFSTPVLIHFDHRFVSALCASSKHVHLRNQPICPRNHQCNIVSVSVRMVFVPISDTFMFVCSRAFLHSTALSIDMFRTALITGSLHQFLNTSPQTLHVSTSDLRKLSKKLASGSSDFFVWFQTFFYSTFFKNIF